MNLGLISSPLYSRDYLGLENGRALADFGNEVTNASAPAQRAGTVIVRDFRSGYSESSVRRQPLTLS